MDCSAAENREQPKRDQATSEQPGEWQLLELEPGSSAALAAEAEHRVALARIETEMDPCVLEVIGRELGPHGRMISGSKSGYCRRFSARLVVFNANLLIDRVKAWWGDLDVTDDEPRLMRIARELGCQLHVLREHDGRFFGKDEAPLVGRFVYWTDGDARVLGEWERDEYEWRRGRIRSKPGRSR